MTLLLDKAQAALALAITPRRLDSRAWRLKVGLRSVRIGREVLFDPRDLSEWVDRQRQQQKPSDVA